MSIWMYIGIGIIALAVLIGWAALKMHSEMDDIWDDEHGDWH